MTESSFIRIELPWIPPAEVRGNSRAHYQAKARKVRELRESGYFLTREAMDGRGPLEKVRVSYEFHHWRKIDRLNLLVGLKGFEDGMVDAGLVADDDPDHWEYGVVAFQKVPKGKEKTVIVVEEVQG